MFAYHGSSVCNVSKTENLNASLDITGSTETSIQNTNATENSTTTREEQKSEISIEKGEAEKNTLEIKCLLQEEVVQSLKSSKPVSLFMMQGWRDQLCNCSNCSKMYQELSLDFLIDPEDTVHYYENKSADIKTSQYEDGMKALSDMDRTKQIEAIHGYNTMKSNLMEYLKKFAENKKVVREEDIQEFFQQMSASKKMRMNIPDNCK